ncbi:MAG: ELWxxDGT repeat protein [Bacteroidota bacterium]
MKNIITALFISVLFNSFSQDIELVKEFIPNSVPQDIVEFDSKLFFSADDGINGRELWSSNGTTAGTTLFKDILSGGASNPEKLKVLNGKLYFIALETLSPARKALYVSDGTVAGTIKLTSLSTNQSNIDATIYFESANNLVFFKNDINALGSELWVTNGTVAGTSQLKDINIGNGSSNPDHFYMYNNKVFFSASNGIDGSELWTSDGTYDGTVMVNPGLTTNTTGPKNFFNYNDVLYYNYDDELWSTNGTLTGTALFKKIHADFKSYPKDFIVYDSKLFFSAQRNGLANELFISNGTPEGTLPVLASMNGYNCSNIRNVLGMLIFSGKSDLHGTEIWMSLGTSQDTRELRNLNNQNGGVDDGIVGDFNIVEANGLAYFSGVQSGTMDELLVTNGTESGTFSLEYVNTTNYDGEPADLIQFNNTVFFSSKYVSNGALYKIAGGGPYVITTSSAPSNGGTTSGDGTYNENESVTVNAIANTNFTFTNWTISGNIVSTSASYTFPAVSNMDLVANFSSTLPTFTITTSALPSNGGTTSGDGTYELNETVDLSAIANTGFTFTNWTISGNIVSTSASYSFPAIADVNIVANFTPSTSNITEYSISDVIVYPNPVDEVLNFTFNSKASLIEISSLDGKLIHSKNINSSSYSMNFYNLYAGVYMYSITFENGSKFSAKFIKN